MLGLANAFRPLLLRLARRNACAWPGVRSALVSVAALVAVACAADERGADGGGTEERGVEDGGDASRDVQNELEATGTRVLQRGDASATTRFAKMFNQIAASLNRTLLEHAS